MEALLASQVRTCKEYFKVLDLKRVEKAAAASAAKWHHSKHKRTIWLIKLPRLPWHYSLQSSPLPNPKAFKRKLITYPRCSIGKVSSSETRGEYSIGSSQSSRFFGGGQRMVVGVSGAARSGPQRPPSRTPLRQTGVKALAFLQMAGPPFFVTEATTRGQTRASWRSTLAPALQSSSHLERKVNAWNQVEQLKSIGVM